MPYRAPRWMKFGYSPPRGANLSDRRLRWGILSTAHIGRSRFVPGVRAGSEGEVVAIASRDQAKASAVAAELNIPRARG